MIENVPEKYRPPQSLWHSPNKCKKWVDEHWDAGDKKGNEEFLHFKENEIEKK